MKRRYSYSLPAGLERMAKPRTLSGEAVYVGVNVCARDFTICSGAWSCRDVGLLMRRVREALHEGDDAFLDTLPWLGKRLVARRARAAIGHETRRRILARDNGTCRRCGVTNRLEIDHIVPVVHGGGDGDENLQVLCRPCNKRKGPAPWERQRMGAVRG